VALNLEGPNKMTPKAKPKPKPRRAASQRPG
jgi:hypothetical protein